MTPRKRHISVVDIRPLNIGGQTTGLAGKGRWVVTLSVCQVPDKRITGLELHATGKSLGHGSGQSVVIAAATIRLDFDQPHGGIAQKRTAGGVAYSIRGKLIRIGLPAEISSMAAVVRKAQSRTETEIASRFSEYRGRMNPARNGRETPDKMLRHIRRVEYLRTHSSALCSRLRLDSPPEVHGLLVVDAPQPMNFFATGQIQDGQAMMLDAIDNFQF